MSHARIEEVEDSDASDPSEGDIDDFDETDILRRVDDSGSRTSQPAPAAARAHLINPANIPSSSLGPLPSLGSPPGGPKFQTTANKAAYAGFQALYPVYFDAARSRANGRRVPAALAVRNPLASEIVKACGALRLQTFFEPLKTHPKDWANPGRVKVQLRDGATGAADIKNKHHLYILVARHLQAHPTTETSDSLHIRIPGIPMPEPGKAWPRPAVPRGWKMGELLPYYSPAMSGGGISENLFKDMMREMQSGGGPGGDMASMLQAAGAMGGGGAPGGAGPSAPGGAIEGKKAKKGKGRG